MQRLFLPAGRQAVILTPETRGSLPSEQFSFWVDTNKKAFPVREGY
jgi:hypothetical protein